MKKEELGHTSLIIFFFVFLSLLLVLLNNGEEKILLIFLPLIYGVIFILLAKIHKYLHYPGMFILNVISAIRYILIPILIIIYPDYNNQYGSLTHGILLMIYEEVCLGIFLIFITKKYYRDRKINKQVEINSGNNLLLKLVVISSICIVIINPSIISHYNFVFMDSQDIELINKGELVSGLSGVVVNWGKLFLPILFAIPLIKKYKKNNNNIYYYLVILNIMLFNVLVFSGTSRNSVIMPAVGSMFFLLKAFPQKRKRIFMLMSLMIVIVAFQLTVLKTEYLGTQIQSSLGGIINYLEVYFSGPKNMSIAIIAKETYSNMFTMNTFINDMLGNFPGLSHLFNMENRTSTFFNLSFYGNGAARDQIIPSMGQGLFYFGYLFSFIPQMLILLGMVKFDSIYRNTKKLTGIYFVSYFAVRFGFTYSQNVSIILSFIYAMIIPILIILILDKMINRGFKFRRSKVHAKNKTFIYNK